MTPQSSSTGFKYLPDTVPCSFNFTTNAAYKHLWLFYAWRWKGGVGGGGDLTQAGKSQDHYFQYFFINNFMRQRQNWHIHQPWFVVHKMDLPTIFPYTAFWGHSKIGCAPCFYHSAYFLQTYVFTSQTETVILPLSFVIRICNNATLLTLLTNHWVYWAKGTTLTTLLW